MGKKILVGDKEEGFDSKKVKKPLQAAGLSERVATEVSEKVEDDVQDGWTVEQVKDDTLRQLRNIHETIGRAAENYARTPGYELERR